jgi:drug/metabolite transporter (DMT)-like permease
MSPVQRFLPELALMTVVVLWASTFIITKDLFNHIAPMAFVGLRFVLICLFSCLVLAVRGWSDPRRYFRIERSDLPRILLAGFTGYSIYQLGFTLGLDNSSPFAAALILTMTPLFSLALVALLGERPEASIWLGVVVAIGGIVVFLFDGDSGGTVAGTLLILMASFGFGVYGMVNRPLVRKYPPETVAAVTTVLGSLPLMLASIPAATDQDWNRVTSGDWLAIGYMVIFPVYVAYILWNWAISRRGVAATSAQLLVPVVSGVLSAIVFGEAFGALKVIGGIIALLGLLLMRYRPRFITKLARSSL